MPKETVIGQFEVTVCEPDDLGGPGEIRFARQSDGFEFGIIASDFELQAILEQADLLGFDELERGQEVTFAHPTWGYPSDQALAQKHLKFGGVYHIADFEIGGLYTTVWLEEVPGIPFNSVLFR